MVDDHFAKHSYQFGRSDWNFNIVFSDLPKVLDFARSFQSKIAEFPEKFYTSIPPKWLHSTILRAGFYEDFSKEDMAKVVENLRPKLASLSLPNFTFSKLTADDNILLHISPEKDVNQIFQIVVDAMHEVLGPDCLAGPLGAYDTFRAHMALAYTKNRDFDEKVGQVLPLENPPSFQIKKLTLARQWAADGHYEWEVLDEIPIGK
jgi:hypothetical protein